MTKQSSAMTRTDTTRRDVAADTAAAVQAMARIAGEPDVQPETLAEISTSIAEAERRIGAAAVRQAFIQAVVDRQPKAAHGGKAAVATSNPAATRAGTRVLEAGGNAVDAACAAALAMTVADPASASVAGRCHVIIRTRAGDALVVDGATQAPPDMPVRPGQPAGIAGVPVPGMLPALGLAAQKGSWPWADLCVPAIELAEDGFDIPRGLATAWQNQRERLASHPHAARFFLKPDGTAWCAGERFRQPALAQFLRHVARDGPRALHEGDVAGEIAQQITGEGGCVGEKNLATYQALQGARAEGEYRNWRFLTTGAQAWGHTLVEMLHIADRFGFSGADWSPEETEMLALAILVALNDRPHEIGTLKPKPDGIPLDVLADRALAADRARLIERLMHDDGSAHDVELRGLIDGIRSTREGDTTHLSVVDSEGTAVALTCSIGPHFGSAVASARHGFLFAHSYRMLSDPTPGARDATEMCPSIFTAPDGRVVAVGGAGSELIPGAVTLTVMNLLGHGWPELQSVAAPRMNWKFGHLRAHCDLAPTILGHLRQRGFPVQLTGRGYFNHVGVVHLAARTAASQWSAAVDTALDGVAAVSSDAGDVR